METLWQIVPNDDGCNVVCLRNNKLSLVHKAKRTDEDIRLSFQSEEAAQDNIAKHLDETKFHAETFLIKK